MANENRKRKTGERGRPKGTGMQLKERKTYIETRPSSRGFGKPKRGGSYYARPEIRGNKNLEQAIARDELFEDDDGQQFWYKKGGIKVLYNPPGQPSKIGEIWDTWQFDFATNIASKFDIDPSIGEQPPVSKGDKNPGRDFKLTPRKRTEGMHLKKWKDAIDSQLKPKTWMIDFSQFKNPGFASTGVGKTSQASLDAWWYVMPKNKDQLMGTEVNVETGQPHTNALLNRENVCKICMKNQAYNIIGVCTKCKPGEGFLDPY